MICINVTMKFSSVSLKRTPVEILLDDKQLIEPSPTDRTGEVCFDIPSSSEKVLKAK